MERGKPIEVTHVQINKYMGAWPVRRAVINIWVGWMLYVIIGISVVVAIGDLIIKTIPL